MIQDDQDESAYIKILKQISIYLPNSICSYSIKYLQENAFFCWPWKIRNISVRETTKRMLLCQFTANGCCETFPDCCEIFPVWCDVLFRKATRCEMKGNQNLRVPWVPISVLDNLDGFPNWCKLDGALSQ